MGRRQTELLIIFSLILGLIGLTIAARFYLTKNPSTQTVQKEQIQAIPNVFADVDPGPKTTTILAPNGKMSLIVKEETQGETTKETFSVMEVDSTTPIEIYSETLSEGASIVVPFNTFSPDNTYIFLKKISPSEVTYFALRTDGKPITGESKTIDFVSLFNEKYPDTPAADVTGWGGMTVIVINTKRPDGKVDRSYWYDAASNSFIGLSTRFN